MAESKSVTSPEVKKLVMDAYGVARKIITDNIDSLHNLAQALLEHEVLDGEEIETVINGGKLPTPAKKQEKEPAKDIGGETVEEPVQDDPAPQKSGSDEKGPDDPDETD